MRNLPTCVQVHTFSTLKQKILSEKKFIYLLKTLVAHGAYLFVENAEHSSPCDLAERCGQKDIALYLESKMIFSVCFYFCFFSIFLLK